MRRGNGYQLCTGANNTCRHRFGACPLHRPMLQGEQARAVLAELGYPVRPGSHKDATCRECGFLVHAPWCSTLAENNCGGQTVNGPPCGGCASCLRKQAKFWAAEPQRTEPAVVPARSEPPPGWLVNGEDGHGWHFGLATSNRTAFGCQPGRCSCYDKGTLDTRHGGKQYSPTREAAVAACWERHEAEQAVLDQAELAKNTCPTCGFQRLLAAGKVLNCALNDKVSPPHREHRQAWLAKVGVVVKLTAEKGRKLCEIGHQFGSSACCVRCGLPAPSPATAYAGFAGDVAEQCKVARAKVEADAAGFVRPPGTAIARAGWYHVGHDTRDPGDKNVYDRYTREDSRASVWQDAMSGKWYAGPWTLTCFSTVNWGFICDDAQSAMACIDRELQEQDTPGVAGKLTAEACALRFHARSKGEACPCGSCKGP